MIAKAGGNFTGIVRVMLAQLFAWVSLALAALPFLGRVSGFIDAFASLLPLVLPLAVAGVVLALWARSRSALLVCALALIGAGVPLYREWSEAIALSGTERPGTGERVTIVTHNVLVSGVDPTLTAEVIRRSGADIVVLQETKGKGRFALRAVRKLFPYGTRCDGECDLAILSRFPVDPVKWRLRDEAGRMFGPGLFWTYVHLPSGRAFRLATMHLPWPLPPERQAHSRASLVSGIEDIDARDLVLAGDFNLTPWGAGMADLDRGMAPMRRVTRGLPTFPSRIGGRPWPVPFLAIDQMFVGPGWEVERVERLDRTASDHLPIKTTLRLKD